MKKIILIALMSTFAMSGITNEAEMKAVESGNENARLCKMFTEKVEAYKSTMRNDELAAATLASYEKRMSTFCGTSVEKVKKEKVETVAAVKAEPAMEVKASENARLCKVFTSKVETYESTMRDDSLAKVTLDSYKTRMSTFCSAPSVKS